jgi:hypothetical protein
MDSEKAKVKGKTKSNKDKDKDKDKDKKDKKDGKEAKGKLPKKFPTPRAFFNNASAAAINDPSVTRAAFIAKGATIKKEDSEKMWSDIIDACYIIVRFSARPDKFMKRIKKVKDRDLSALIRGSMNFLKSFEKTYGVRATQLQASFPDIISHFKSGLYNLGCNVQRFVPEEIIPIQYQFPGSAPVVPKAYKELKVGEDAKIAKTAYRQLVEAITKAFGGEKAVVNETIYNASLNFNIAGFVQDLPHPDIVENRLVENLLLEVESDEEEENEAEA